MLKQKSTLSHCVCGYTKSHIDIDFQRVRSSRENGEHTRDVRNYDELYLKYGLNREEKHGNVRLQFGMLIYGIFEQCLPVVHIFMNGERKKRKILFTGQKFFAWFIFQCLDINSQCMREFDFYLIGYRSFAYSYLDFCPCPVCVFRLRDSFQNVHRTISNENNVWCSALFIHSVRFYGVQRAERKSVGCWRFCSMHLFNDDDDATHGHIHINTRITRRLANCCMTMWLFELDWNCSLTLSARHIATRYPFAICFCRIVFIMFDA